MAMAPEAATGHRVALDLDAWHQQYESIWGTHSDDLPASGVLTFARPAQPDELSAKARDSGRAPMLCRHAPVADLARAIRRSSTCLAGGPSASTWSPGSCPR